MTSEICFSRFLLAAIDGAQKKILKNAGMDLCSRIYQRWGHIEADFLQASPSQGSRYPPHLIDRVYKYLGFFMSKGSFDKLKLFMMFVVSFKGIFPCCKTCVSLFLLVYFGLSICYIREGYG
jgi:hypothetical protein